MNTCIGSITLLFAVLLFAGTVCAQEGPVPSPEDTISKPAWTLTPSLLTILYRDTIALWNPAFTADHNNLHMEARYQWEDWRTASLWAGRWFRFGDALHVDIAPMIGGVFGYSSGIAPGMLVEAEWKRLSFYSSTEHLFVLQDRDANFTYTWNELSIDLDVVLVGIVTQRTRTFNSPLDLQRGLLVMHTQGDLIFGMYLFNGGWTDPTVAFTVSYGITVPHHRPPDQRAN